MFHNQVRTLRNGLYKGIHKRTSILKFFYSTIDHEESRFVYLFISLFVFSLSLSREADRKILVSTYS